MEAPKVKIAHSQANSYERVSSVLKVSLAPKNWFDDQVFRLALKKSFFASYLASLACRWSLVLYHLASDVNFGGSF